MVRRTAAPTAKAIKFFTRHAPVRGLEKRRNLGRRLAVAEAEASARGWRCEWLADPDGDDEHEALGAVLRDDHGYVLGQVWGVRGDRDVRRVVEAKLALDALEER